jgi:RNA polymerase sigma-70 factor (ECF subfamily)
MGGDTETLWEAWRTRRDGRAFDALVRPELGRALAFARTLGCSPEEAEDALQDSLVRLAGERGNAPARLGVRAWFYRTVRDRARSRRRSWWRSRARERKAARPEAVPPGDRQAAIREEVECILATLAAGDREAVTLHYLQDLDYREMGVVLGASENACRIRVHRALERLRASLGPGAATMIAALPLPAVTGGASMVKAALAGAAGGGAAAGTTGAAGGVAMASTTKSAVTAAAALGLAAAAGGGGYFLGSAGPGSAPVAGRTGPPVASTDGVVSRSPGAGESAPASSPASPAAPTGEADPLAGLSLTAEEREFLRGALVAERARREAARIDPSDGGLDVLRRTRESGAPTGDLLRDHASMAAHVRTGDGEGREIASDGKDPTVVNLADLAGKSAVVRFGPGRFVLDRRSDEFRNIRKGRVVDSIEIRGAGMDRTTLELGDSNLLFVSGVLKNLRIRDLTIDQGLRGRNLLDARGEVALSLENVRFLGTDTYLHVSGPFYLAARGCEFLGGGETHTLALRARGLALFEDCLFADQQAVFLGNSGGSAGMEVALRGCTFENSHVADSRMEYQGKPEYAIRVSGGKVLLGPPDMDPADRRKRWGGDWVTATDDVRWGEGAARFTVGDLLNAVGAASVGGDDFLLCIRPLEARGAGARILRLDIGERTSGSKRARYVAWSGSSVEDVKVEDRSGGPGLPKPGDVAGLPDLASAVRRSAIPLDAACASISYGHEARVDGNPVPTIHVQGPRDWPSWTIAAGTGEILFKSP